MNKVNIISENLNKKIFPDYLNFLKKLKKINHYAFEKIFEKINTILSNN